MTNRDNDMTERFLEDIIGDLLHATMTAYFAELDTTDEILATTMGIIRARVPSLGMFSLAIDTHDIFGVPVSAGASGFKMDVDKIMQVVFAKDGNKDTVKQYMLASGMRGSGLENVIFEQTYELQSILAVKALQIANEQGIPVHTVNQNNLSQVLPKLTISDEVKTDITNAVNAGKVVTVPQRNLQLKAWNGIGYIMLDPTTGVGAYMISGGTAGGATIGDFMSCLTELTQFVAAFWSGNYVVEFLGFISGIIDALNNPNANMIAPLFLLASIGFLFGVIFVYGGIGLTFLSANWFIFNIVTGFVGILHLWASNLAATGSPMPSTLWDDCLPGLAL